jgi:hypothetical protein
MGIGDFDIAGIASAKLEAHAKSIFDADTPLSGAVSRELLEPMRWRDPEVVDGGGGINALEPHPCASRDLG